MNSFKASVYRTRPLPMGELVGRFLLPQALVTETRNALVESTLAGLAERGHEGLAFWAGLQVEPLTVFTTVIVPRTKHSHGGVFVSEEGFGQAVRAWKDHGVVILAQVHSHPGDDARHSDGDDELITMPFEGMLSVVVPDFGVGWSDLSHAGIHQFQRGRWVHCSAASVRASITVAPAVVDAR